MIRGLNSSEDITIMIAREKIPAVVELCIACALWGFGFIAAAWALEGMGPLAITGWRFAIAFAVGLPVILITPSLRPALRWSTFSMAAVPGALISACLIAQTWGLQTTTATKSSFITVTYVLIVPFIELLFMKKYPTRRHLICAIGALIGVALICHLETAFSSSGTLEEVFSNPKAKLNFGDALTLLCAILASAHILWFGWIGNRIGSAFAFNIFQSFWAAVVPLGLSLVFEAPPQLNTPHPIIGLAMLSLGSTLIAFALQIRAQKKISPSLASLLFLLESPFATVFAVVFLGEVLSTSDVVGCSLILVSLAASVVSN